MKRKLSKFCFALFLILFPIFGYAVSIGGPLSASSVTVSGDVSVSSITVSNLTIQSWASIQATVNGITGGIIQQKICSSTVPTTVTSTSFTAISDMQKAITLSNENNYVKISLSGSMFTILNGDEPVYLTVYRNSTNLGNGNEGLQVLTSTPTASSAYNIAEPLSVKFIDSPGNTNSNTYQVYIRASKSGQLAEFPFGTGYLLLEEIGQ